MVKKRVAIIVGSLNGGGMERVAAQLSEMLSGEFEMFMFLLHYDRKKSYPHKGKVKIIPNHVYGIEKSRYREAAFYWKLAYEVRKLKKDNKIDVSISFAPEMNMINFLSGATDKKIFTIHSCISKRNDFNTLVYWKIFMKVCNFSDRTVTVSNWCKEDLIANYGIKKNKIRTIYNSVQILENLKYIEKENIVLVVGRFHDVKQQWHIIRAFKQVKECVPNARLYIAGEGENEKYLRSLVKDLQLEQNVIFTGFIKNIEILYEKAKLLVFSSASEAFPCSVLEAISYGIPIVAADCPGGIREIVMPEKIQKIKSNKFCIAKCGILTPALDGIKYKAKDRLTKSEEQLAEGIKLLLTDKDLYEKCRDGCKQAVKRFEAKKIKNIWRKQIAEVLYER